MAFTTDYSDAAQRNFHAANCLCDCEPSCRRRDVAGYLYGIAAECALKQIMRRSQAHNTSRPERPDDPLWQHFPLLKTLLRDQASGRHAGVLRRFAEDTGFMNEWDVSMRYAPRRDVGEPLVAKWRADAKRALDALENC